MCVGLTRLYETANILSSSFVYFAMTWQNNFCNIVQVQIFVHEGMKMEMKSKACTVPTVVFISVFPECPSISPVSMFKASTLAFTFRFFSFCCYSVLIAVQQCNVLGLNGCIQKSSNIKSQNLPNKY